VQERRVTLKHFKIILTHIDTSLKVFTLYIADVYIHIVYFYTLTKQCLLYVYRIPFLSTLAL